MFVETRPAMKVSTSGSADGDPVGRHLLAQDRDPRLEVGRLDVGDQPPLEPRPQALLERRDLLRRPVGRDHDLAAGLVERVEGVEELLLDPLLALEELDVVDEEDVVGAVALLEALDALVAERVDEVVHERLARHVARRRALRVLAHVLADRLQEMGLAEPGAAVDEERVVRLGRRLGDGERRGVGEAVRRADHEEVEGVLRRSPPASARRARPPTGVSLATSPAAARRLAHGQRHPDVAGERVARCSLHEPEEVPLDPLAGEVVRDDEREACRRRARPPRRRRTRSRRSSR